MRVFLNNAKARPCFAQVLEEAARAAGIDGDQRRETTRPRPVGPSLLDVLTDAVRELRVSNLSVMLQAYLEQQSTRKPTPRRPMATDPQSISAELRITDKMTSPELARLRRRFAMANHPDRVLADEREIATRRMMVANMLIDRAMKRRMCQ
ncbi:Molecular chaperone DnaJ [Hyphomicrobium sp. 1Nfss2.1]|uniref:hypothetical protein n=1 Tax=Hyphomicrobium sp. 1Nfss2.1 TaxID=3413936 RepID=UPI003C7C5FE7